MTAALAELSLMSSDLGLTDHLPECLNSDEDWRSCRWCLWAIDTPEVTTLLDVGHDCRALAHGGSTDTVAWVVAADQLFRTVEGIDYSTIHLRSVRDLADRLQLEMDAEMTCLGHRLRAATSAGGPIEQRCLRTAGAIAATALQMSDQQDRLSTLPDSIRNRVAELAASLSPDTQAAYLLPAIEHQHWHGMPTLRTQPEWSRRAAPDDAGGLRARQLAGTELKPGSLESLVVESVIDQVTQELADIGTALGNLAPQVTLCRAIGEPPLTSSTRSLMWRSARIDWMLTFIDTGRAYCWNARTRDGLTLTDVPWHVALATRATDHYGLVSAVHRDRPSARQVNSDQEGQR